MTKVNGSVTWDYTYNANGMRIKRTNGSKTYEYTYAGSELVHMSVNGEHLRFGHTPDGVPFNVVYGAVTYFYVTNLQGDVVAILDYYGDPMVYYTYDAWGNILSITGEMADTLGVLNPLRYRGYVYDQETGLYYLQTRYYNPEMGRFINADNYQSTGQGLTGNNMFAYCGNNPVSRKDDNGEGWLSALVGAVVGGVIGGISAAVTGGKVVDIIIGAASGAASGAIIAGTGNVKAARLAGATINALGTMLDAKINGASDIGATLAAANSFVLTYGASTLNKYGIDDNFASTLVDCTFGFGAALLSSAGTTLAVKTTQEFPSSGNSTAATSVQGFSVMCSNGNKNRLCYSL